MNYHISKRRAEEVVLAGSADGLNAVIVNPSIIFGPKAGGYQGAHMLGQPLRHRIIVNGPGGCCIAHVSDVVEGILLAIRRGRGGERYILGGANVTFSEISRTVSGKLALTRFHLPIPGTLAEYGNRIKGRLRATIGASPSPVYDLRFCHQYYDSTKARKELGYQSRSFDEIVEDCIACLGWRENRANRL
jgi:dihydroflavonol-4-reductase